MNISELKKLVEKGFTSLRKRDNRQARELFQVVIETGAADATTWLGMAHASSRLGDDAAVVNATDEALKLEPDNLRALLFKADYLTQKSQPRRAMVYYQRALQCSGTAGELPQDVVVGLQRAEQICADRDREYQSFLTQKLRSGGYTPAPANTRFQQSLDILFGAKRVYYQEPRRYYFPGLPQIEFYERDQFPWAADLEANTPGIREELDRVMTDPRRFSPYLSSTSEDVGSYGGELIDSNDWGTLYLWDHGRFAAENSAEFPLTLGAFDTVPLLEIPQQSPMLLFSRLTAGTHVPPHHGMLNTRLICHLPVIVPEHCGALRVGNQQRSWVEGEMLVFDDSIEHEAWNTSAAERVVLLFEIWRPELNEEERRLVTDLLMAVEDYSASDT